MNGRVYDPLLGRMLSPDNFVQAPDFTQSYNRYSYAWNNPLIFTDPSGNELGYNWEGREEYYSEFSIVNPIAELFGGIYTEIVYLFGGDIGRDGEVKFPDQYKEEKTYYRSEPGYSEYTSQEDIDDLWYDLDNSDYERGSGNNNLGPGIGEISTDAIFYGQRPDGSYFRGGPLYGWHDNVIPMVRDPRATRIPEETFRKVANSIEYFLSGGQGPAPPEIQPGYVYIAWPHLSSGNTAEGWRFGVARIRDAVNIRPVIPFAFGTFDITYETNPLNPSWDPLVPRR